MFTTSRTTLLLALALTAAALPLTRASTAQAALRANLEVGGAYVPPAVIAPPPVVAAPPSLLPAPPPMAVYAPPPVYTPDPVLIAPRWAGGAHMAGHAR